jgi:hydroxymethylbilane synthase
MAGSTGADQKTGKSLLLGTRGSPLALWQANWVAGRLRQAHPGLVVELVEIKTRGDRDRNTPFAQMTQGGTGLFTKEIQRAVLDGTVDLAVHSLKDLPTAGPEGLVLGAIPVREEVVDLLISPRHGRLDQLPAGATVGTGSLRRKAQLLHLRPDLEVVGVRGNVETRLAKAESGELDAVVLAAAGLSRLGLRDRATEVLGPPPFLPAVGQGALGLECRATDDRARALVGALDDPATRAAVTAERRTLAELEGGCMIPLAAWGRVTTDGLVLDVAVYSADGQEKVFVSRTGRPDNPEELGSVVAEELRQKGAEHLLRGDGGDGKTHAV